ncbi:acetyl-CoA carboxylase biotin carboxyl carrier protein subunit [Bacteroides ihuae]|uniref:acetyl-CoA carboxylase biotin carboxyl carrier protein subunit n=1 Tax=Bacteroides ihuae TaxID=1852362 RepID=UPI0008D9E037|nr:acetyl-CoA carboxylase biotin carboxyl carrier protein subunit [Bacteroides ihuae]
MEIHIDNRVAEIQLVSKEGNNVVLSIDGKEFVVDVVMAENGACSILHDGKSYNAQLIRQDKSKKYQINTFSSSFNVEIVDTQAKYLQMKKKAMDMPEDKITSPMSGKVISIPVSEGQSIKAGDVLIVVEAMKMQNNYKASSDGKVKNILVKEGDTINGNQILITLDLKKD